MKNTILTLINPLILGKIKPYQNLSLIISCVVLLIAFILSWFDNKMLSNMIGYLIAISGVLIIIFILLSLPFFFKKLEIATITNGIMYINIDHKPAEFNTQNLRFLLNIDNMIVGGKEPLIPEIVKDLSTWGNYIVIPSESAKKDIYIQFIPDENLFKVIPQLKIDGCKSRSILMNNTSDLFKNIMWMLWGAS